ncbi:hypothetical protein PPM_p0005 (plasmid) [Paenibacillus polymyxa M1]|nr:hypothetical protein PPM_p0005 [Paenibacillus polymyxa M1]
MKSLLWKVYKMEENRLNDEHEKYELDFDQICNDTSQAFTDFIQLTLREWNVKKYKWRFDPNWAGEKFVHILVYDENLNEYDHMMQFVYRSGRFYFNNMNSGALMWLKENL